MMEKIGKLQDSYEKELDLSKKHRRRAEELKQKIEEQKASALQKKTQELQLTAEEYERLLSFLSDKDSVLSALSIKEVEEAVTDPDIEEAAGIPEKEEEEMM